MLLLVLTLLPHAGPRSSDPISTDTATAGGDLADAFRQIAALRDMIASGSAPHAATAAAAAAGARHGVFVVTDYGADPSGINQGC